MTVVRRVLSALQLFVMVEEACGLDHSNRKHPRPFLATPIDAVSEIDTCYHPAIQIAYFLPRDAMLARY